MKQLNLVCVCTFLLSFSLVAIAQDSDDSVEQSSTQIIHNHESLRALEYDADIAESRDAEGLSEYLTGNILIGTWGKSNTRQYFAPSGSTWYQEEDNPQSHGTWRVKDDGKYCSVWPPSRAESCYTVTFIDDVLFWHSGRNRYPSAIQIIKKESLTEDTKTSVDESN